MKSTTTAIMICTILLAIMLAPAAIREGNGQESRVIRILNANSGMNITTVGNYGDPMPTGGLTFTVNVTLTGTTDLLFNYEIAITYNRTLVRCTGAWINKDDPAFVFNQIKNDVVIPPEPEIRDDIGYVATGASSLFKDQYVNVSSGLLAQINFTAIKRGDSALGVIPTEDPAYSLYADTYLWNPDQQYIPFTSESLSLTAECGPSSPVAMFSHQPDNPNPGAEVAFDAKNSYDPYGNITSYVWNFADGSNEENTTMPQIAHTFASLGAYLVNLTVMNDFAFNPAYNYSNSIVNEIQVGQIPGASFAYEPVQPRGLTEITFDASQSSAPSGSIATYSWSFGDGIENTISSPTITHVFTSKGVYSISLTVVDNHGLHDSISAVIQVGGIPTAFFTFSPKSPDVDEVVSFNATLSRASDEGDTIVSYVWDFGDTNITQIDASTPNAATPQHSYIGLGDYSVNLTIYDNNGLFNTNVQNITVEHKSPPDYTTYILIGVTVALLVIVGAVVLQRRSRLRRHTPKPAKSSPK